LSKVNSYDDFDCRMDMSGYLYRLHGRFTIRIKPFTLEFNADFLMMDEHSGGINPHGIRTPFN